MTNVLQRIGSIVFVALLANAATAARPQVEASTIAQFQRAADSYAFQHRQAERRGVPQAPLVEGAFFTPQAAAAFRDRIRKSGCDHPRSVDGDSAVPRPNDPVEGTSALTSCLTAVLPPLPAELAYRSRGVALLLADAHLGIIVDVLHAAFPVRNN